MPKNKRKGGKGKGGRAESSGSDDDGSMFNDNASVSSMAISEVSTMQNEEGGGGAVDEYSAEEVFENKMKDAIDLAAQKSASGRAKALQAMCQGFYKRYMPDFVENRRVTISDLVEKGLKKGKGEELAAASQLALLLAIQLPDCEDVYKDLKGTMTQMVTDNTLGPEPRSTLVTCLTGLCYMGGGEMAEVVSTMNILEAIFVQSCPKKDGTVPSISPGTLMLHANCASSWALLSTLLSPAQIHDMVDRRVKLFAGLFSSPDVDLRIAAGETIALLLEGAYEYREDFELDFIDELLDSLKQMSTEHSKSRSKKDRKEQRSSFRDILRAVEDGDPPSFNIKFGRETLKIDSWLKKCQYDWFCKVMGPGMNYHLTVNYMLREILELGAPIPVFDADSAYKPTKLERHAANQTAFKLRTQTRGKNRDKRSAVV